MLAKQHVEEHKMLSMSTKDHDRQRQDLLFFIEEQKKRRIVWESHIAKVRERIQRMQLAPMASHTSEFHIQYENLWKDFRDSKSQLVFTNQCIDKTVLEMERCHTFIENRWECVPISQEVREATL